MHGSFELRPPCGAKASRRCFFFSITTESKSTLNKKIKAYLSLPSPAPCLILAVIRRNRASEAHTTLETGEFRIPALPPSLLPWLACWIRLHEMNLLLGPASTARMCGGTARRIQLTPHLEILVRTENVCMFALGFAAMHE